MALKLRSSAILMKDNDLCLLGDSNLHSFEKMRLLSTEEFDILHSIDRQVELSNFESTKKIIDYWISVGVVIDENKKTLAAQKLKELKRIMTDFQKVKPNKDVIDYHKDAIESAQVQFDYNETTLSHLYRNKNIVLNNLSYGEALCDRLLKVKGEWNSLKVLEIGCGTGLLAKNVLNRLKDAHPNLYKIVEYDLFDLSPALQKSQKTSTLDHSEKVRFITGNIEDADIKSKYDLIICNEVIADLNVSVCNKDLSLSNEVGKLINQYGLDINHFPSKFLINFQAIKFIETFPLMLKDDGVGFISEYGSWSEIPKVVELPGHNEYSINFSHLASVAEQNSLSVQFESMDELLEFNKSVSILDDAVRETFSDNFLPFLGFDRLERVPCEKQKISDLLGKRFKCFKRLPFSPLGEGRSTLDPKSFKALILHKLKV